MKIKKIALSIVALGLLSIPSSVSADEAASDFSWLDKSTWSVEASGELMSKIGVFISKGASNNPKLNADGTADEHYAGELFRSELTAKLFLNQEIGDQTSWHSELQFNRDGNGIDGYDASRLYSQFDWLRELYVDTREGRMSWRIGKQQVVWGKADGVKFLDIINPTDFRHWGQDSMADSRIPLWMITGEYAIGDTDSLQVVYVPQTDITNQIPGLYNTTTGDQGQPFVPKGMDTMFGQQNGFMNIGPEMGAVAGAFTQAFSMGMTGAPVFNPATGALTGGGQPNILQGFGGMTVNGFTANVADVGAFIYNANINNGLTSLAAATQVNALGLSVAGAGGVDTAAGMAVLNGNQMLSNTVNLPQPNGIGAKTNLFGVTLNTSNPTTMFDYMGDTTFATFDAFIGMKTKHVKDHPANAPLEGNLGVRYSGSTDIGLNYTLNYYYHYDNNPVINVSWEGTNGAALSANPTRNDYALAGNLITANVAEGSALSPGAAYRTKTMNLLNANGTAYNYSTSGPATMVFTETQNRINTFGTSFDYAIDTPFAPVILRSEIVYDKDTLQPVVDLGKLAYGDLAGAFQNERADFLNYVVGLDVTVMTNLFVSVQFMDKWNLDYVDEKVQYTGNSKEYGKFTANPATMSLSNGFKPAEEHQIMYTFFLSKPLLENDAMRVNNIFLYEQDNGGYWDRFDVEYSYSDNVILSAAYNQYGGDDNGVFGQFKKMSNAQVGFKYIF